MLEIQPSSPTQSWTDLLAYSQEMFPDNALNSHRTLSTCGINFDYSNQKITDKTLGLLLDLADQCKVREKIHALMRGDRVNFSENKPALHTALRAARATPLLIDGQDIMPAIMAARKKMQQMVEKIRDHKWLGFSGQPIRDIVNIGIGGSDLAARLCLQALRELSSGELRYHFITDADPKTFDHTVKQLQPETTLFIVSSKSFTTEETLYNASKALNWIGKDHSKQHFIAVTANTDKAISWGVHHILPIWDWVGGRYSLFSAINLITAIAVGQDNFDQLLAGANSMDQHFNSAEFSLNLPVMLALIGVWNHNCLKINNLLILTYSQQLEHLVPYIQQLEMESNGKSMDVHGNPIMHTTSPIIWGGSGNQAQHSYYQLLCQGTHKVCADFISLDIFSGEMINNMCLAKIQTLSQGITDPNHPEHKINSNVVLNHIRLQDCSPFTLGALIALYEHKVFVQSVIWNINPFDQPGVESAKLHRRTYGL